MSMSFQQHALFARIDAVVHGIPSILDTWSGCPPAMPLMLRQDLEVSKTLLELRSTRSNQYTTEL